MFSCFTEKAPTCSLQTPHLWTTLDLSSHGPSLAPPDFDVPLEGDYSNRHQGLHIVPPIRQQISLSVTKHGLVEQ